MTDPMTPQRDVPREPTQAMIAAGRRVVLIARLPDETPDQWIARFFTAMYDAAPAAAPADPPTEFAWVIVSKLATNAPFYWTGGDESGANFCPNNALAVRFCRQQDAEAACKGWHMVRVEQHGWMTAAAPAAPAPIGHTDEGAPIYSSGDLNAMQSAALAPLKRCPDGCGRPKARNAVDCVAGCCSKWYAPKDRETHAECARLAAFWSAAPAPDADGLTIYHKQRYPHIADVPACVNKQIDRMNAQMDSMRALIEQQARELAQVMRERNDANRACLEELTRADRAERDLSAARAAIAALIAWWDDEITPMDMERERRVWTAARAAMGEK